MLELQNLNQKIISDFVHQLSRFASTENKMTIILAVKHAIKKELPNAPDYIVKPIVTKLQKQLELPSYRMEAFKSEDAAKNLFEKLYKHELDIAEKESTPANFRELIYATYDLCKYDKKMIFDGEEHFFNIFYLLSAYRLHKKAWKKWKFLKKNKPPEENINISLNTNKSPIDRLKFLNNHYRLYKNNPLSNSHQVDMQLAIMDGYKEDRYMMARSISAIKALSFDIKQIKESSYAQIPSAFKNISPFLDSDDEIKEKDITHSWLTSIALVYLKVNPNNISYTTLARYITTVAKFTVDAYIDTDREYIFKPDILKKPIREKSIFHGVRLFEFSDNRKKITQNEENIAFTESYLLNITEYLRKS